MRKKKIDDPITSMQIHESTKNLLRRCSRLGETHEAAIRRIIAGLNEVDFDILSVDDDAIQDHKVLFKLGNVVHLMDRGEYREIEKPKLMLMNEPWAMRQQGETPCLKSSL